MEFYFDIGMAVMLRVLKTLGPANPYRKAFLKLFRSIALAYKDDPEFGEPLSK